jgi:hypothetical protein
VCLEIDGVAIGSRVPRTQCIELQDQTARTQPTPRRHSRLTRLCWLRRRAVSEPTPCGTAGSVRSGH